VLALALPGSAQLSCPRRHGGRLADSLSRVPKNRNYRRIYTHLDEGNAKPLFIGLTLRYFTRTSWIAEVRLDKRDNEL